MLQHKIDALRALFKVFFKAGFSSMKLSQLISMIAFIFSSQFDGIVKKWVIGKEGSHAIANYIKGFTRGRFHWVINAYLNTSKLHAISLSKANSLVVNFSVGLSPDTILAIERKLELMRQKEVSRHSQTSVQVVYTQKHTGTVTFHWEAYDTSMSGSLARANLGAAQTGVYVVHVDLGAKRNQMLRFDAGELKKPAIAEYLRELEESVLIVTREQLLTDEMKNQEAKNKKRSTNTTRRYLPYKSYNMDGWEKKIYGMLKT